MAFTPFRVRLALAFGLGAVVPVLLFGLGVRREMTRRLDAQAARRVEALVASLRADLDRERADTRRRLASLADDLAGDNRFRLAVQGGDRRWLLDWAGEAMVASGLGLLTIQDSLGRILSSGHFRNDFDRVDSALPRLVVEAPDRMALVRARTAGGEVLALASADSFRVGGQPYTVVGGRSVDSARFARLGSDGEIGVVLVIGDAACAACGTGRPVAEIPFAYVDDAAAEGPATARLIVTRDPGPADALRRGVTRWWLAALLLTLVGSVAIAAWLAGRVSRPIAALAEKTARLDLERLDQRFGSDRDDEIGALARVLDAMSGRLRTGAARLREAERRATVGDLARQVNHDIKNGLAPIRHVVRHLAATAETEPDRLVEVFRERRATLESSVDYLDNLARNYARLSPAPGAPEADLNALLSDVARSMATGTVPVDDTGLAVSLPPARAEPVALRRIVENLVANAIESHDGGPGLVVVATALTGGPAEPRLRLTVTDRGRGMSAEELDLAFDDFHTSKPAGTGLGLSVVRRLVADLGGSVRVETEPGRGTTFTVELPTA